MAMSDSIVDMRRNPQTRQTPHTEKSDGITLFGANSGEALATVSARWSINLQQLIDQFVF